MILIKNCNKYQILKKQFTIINKIVQIEEHPIININIIKKNLFQKKQQPSIFQVMKTVFKNNNIIYKTTKIFKNNKNKLKIIIKVC